jgi:hypothetical protein
VRELKSRNIVATFGLTGCNGWLNVICD